MEDNTSDFINLQEMDVARQEPVNVPGVQRRMELERQDLHERREQVKAEFIRLARRKIVLQDEKKKLRLEQSNLEQDKKAFDNARKSAWFQMKLLPTSELRRIKISVGGHLFETSETVLKRDRGSLLAALVGPDAPLKPNEEGVVYIDRDWWLFRNILCFLRDGRIPKDHNLLAQLYKEAEFYELESLRCAVREALDPQNVVERSAAIPINAIHKLESTIRTSLNRLDRESVGEQVRHVRASLKKEYEDNTNIEEKELETHDWWTSARHHGKDYSLPATAPWEKLERGWTKVRPARNKIQETPGYSS